MVIMDIQMLIYLSLLYCFCQHSTAANVLCASSPHVSHLLPVVNIGKVLKAKYNHTLSIVADDHAIKSPLLQNTDIHFIESKVLSDMNFVERASSNRQDVIEGKLPVFNMMRMFLDTCESILKDRDIIEQLKIQKYDLMITITGFKGDCFNYVAYKLSIPIIHYGPYYDAIYTGIPFNPSVTPEYPSATYGESMTFLQRVKNTMMFYMKPVFKSLTADADISTKHVPEKPYISPKELRRHVQFNILDFDVLMDYPRPSMPNTAFVGGLNTAPPKKLNEDFQSLMDSATKGIFVVSFGSTFKEFPQDKLQNIFKAMKQVKSLKFVMKYGKESKQDGNINFRPWLPQNDLLAHKNTRAFITHCGNSGQYEALYHGVPMIGIPVIGDEFYNAERMKNKGYGLYVPLLSVETNYLTSMIEEVVKNPSYKGQIVKASEIFKSRQGGSPSERAAYWVDHVIKYGGSYMHSIGSDLPWYIYFGCDVWFFILTLVLIFYVAFAFGIRSICQFLCKKRKLKMS